MLYLSLTPTLSIRLLHQRFSTFLPLAYIRPPFSEAVFMQRLLIITLLALSFTAKAQPRQLAAVKTATAPKIDGVLNEALWKTAPVATQFTQNFPDAGKPSQQRTEVRLLYDDNAIYVGAFLYDDPSLIRRQLTARDGESRQDVDYFAVFFDTYSDQQNGFHFGVTSRNVQTDARLGGSGGNDDYGDKLWDAVWASQVAITDSGWSVEMKIPYISLRFAKTDVQTWGLQLLRSNRRLNETSFFNPVDPNVAGFVNQFGKYGPLQNLQPPLRLSFSPYISAGYRSNPPGSRTKTDFLRSGGMDVKWGINESFTLDATLIPDFGQVISDNVINNLSAFEQQFAENRPFFTEGTELFNKAGLFYSRRIGATPADYSRVYRLYEGDSNFTIRRNPSLTQLYNAVKISGRTQKKLGIGVFNAVTAPMNAELQRRSNGKDTSVLTEPLTNYNIVVLDQAFGGRSSVTFTNTSVLRSGHFHDANVSALDAAFYTKDNNYVLSGTVRYSKIFGNRSYSSLYFMNTDTVTIGGRRYLKPYDGYAANLEMGKVGGRWQYSFGSNLESAKYDPRDLGFLQAPNELSFWARGSYNQFTPTKHFIRYNYRLNISREYLLTPLSHSETEVSASGFWWFKNFWDLRVFALYNFGATDFFDLQTKGYRLYKPSFYYTEIGGSTDSRKRLYVFHEFGYANGALKNDDYIRFQLGVRYRFNDRLTMSMEANREHDFLQIGYSFNREADGAPIVGYRDNRSFTTLLSGIYNFTPRMNVTLRARHYWNRVGYLSFYNVDGKGRQIPRAFIPDQNQNVNIYNLDAFFTWDFLLGSRIIAGWKNWLGNAVAIDGLRNTNYFENIKGVFQQPHGNEFTLRIIYFLDYNSLRRKGQTR